MGKNQLIHGNEFHLLKQAEIHKATGKLVESLNLAAGSTGGFDIYKVVEAYFTDLEKRKEINDLLGISEPCETRVTEEFFSYISRSRNNIEKGDT